MKIHNIAVAGIFVTIFGLIDTAHADTTTTIASQAYVDAKDDLKENTGNKYDIGNGTYASLAAAHKDSPTEFPTMNTLKKAVESVDTSGSVMNTDASDHTNVLDFTTHDTNKSPSVNAVQSMVRKSDATGGAIRATSSASDTLVPTEKAVATALSDDKESNNVIKSSNTTKNATVAGIQRSILYSGNNANTNNHTDNVDTTNITANAAVLTTNATVKAHGDDYVPTVAAVEARVKAVEGRTLAGNTTNRDGLTTRDASNVITSTGSDTNIPSTALLVDVLQTLDGANANGTTGVSAGADADATKAGQPVVAVSQTDGKVTATLGTVKYKTGMNNALMNTNTGAALGTSDCKKDNPCVLTYYTDGANTFMRWTPMDTNSTNANVTLASGE